MKIKNVFLSCLMLCGVLTASAQEAKTEYVHNPYWYIQLQGGAQYTLGEIAFKDLISPNVQVTVGRQFTPVFGARLAVNAWQSRAGIDFTDETFVGITGNATTGYTPTAATVPGGTTKWKWMYVAPGIDLTFNLSNLFCGYNPNRIFNFSVFAGAGANIAWGMDKDSNWENAELLAAHFPVSYVAGTNPENIAYAWDGTKVRMFGRAGVAADFKVSDAVSLGLEVNANTLSDRYNGKKASNWDWYFNALAGVKINLGQTYTTRTIEAPKPVERVVEKVIERVVEKPAPVVTQAVVEKKEPFRRDVFFQINKTAIAKSEAGKVQEVAEYLNANPNAKVEVTGYADIGTGNPTINKRLSKLRAESVFNALTKQYKIDASRIKVDYKGDTIQPFAKEADNRVAICIAE
ncbi:MAG: OmpA family protein [Prevotella sp.]|jgi:outer membrane protein OmpA-like peptidoglycan-associated protein|nr:OmpA family protein [Prevotella sp.]